jgi:predicted nucleic acid-binding protein
LYLIDTNIFLEVMLKRRNKNDCVALLRKIDRGEIKAFTTIFTIHSIEVVMDKAGEPDALKTFLKSIIRFKGLSIYSTTLDDEISVIDEMKTGLDFDDALQSYVARKFNLKIVSFDKHFDSVEGLSRLRPYDIIN